MGREITAGREKPGGDAFLHALSAIVYEPSIKVNFD